MPRKSVQALALGSSVRAPVAPELPSFTLSSAVTVVRDAAKRPMRAVIFAFVSPYVKYNFEYAAVRFESQLLNGERCKDRQRFMRFPHSEGKADHVWCGTQWQLANAAWVCGAQQRCTSTKTFHFVEAAARLAAASPSCRAHPQVP